MARFVFKLRSLLEIRQNEEDRVSHAVARLARERTRIEERIRRHQTELSEGKSTMRGRLVGTVDTDALRLHAHAALGVIREAQVAAIKLAGLTKRLGRARGELMVAQARRRAVELLREHRLEEWRLEQERREVAVLDDLACASAARKESMT